VQPVSIERIQAWRGLPSYRRRPAQAWGQSCRAERSSTSPRTTSARAVVRSSESARTWPRSSTTCPEFHGRASCAGQVGLRQVLTPVQRLAQLLQRIDVFTAKLSRRRTRPGSNATVEARDACLDPSGLPDATGATMLRVLGLYPPGSFVRLASGERRNRRRHSAR
jgi:hypothetical protein